MTGKTINRKRRLQLIAAAILLIGLASAAMIYHAEINAEKNLMYDPQMSKSYRRNLELYGGKMTLLANDLYYGFCDLWEGKQLAYTIGWGSLLISGALFWFSRHVRPDASDSETRHTTQS